MEEKSKYETSETAKQANLYIPKQIGEITLCGTLHIAIMEDSNFIRPTEEQIKNLHDMLCIDVKMFDYCKDCRYFRTYKDTGDTYCDYHGCGMNGETYACDGFVLGWCE